MDLAPLGFGCNGSEYQNAKQILYKTEPVMPVAS